MKHKKIIILLFLILFILTAGIFIYNNLLPAKNPNSPDNSITNFSNCAGAGYPVSESYPRQCRTPDGKVFIEETDNSRQIQDGQTSIRGQITCLPKKGSGQQTMECAIGFKGSDGKYYALKNLSQFDPDGRFSTVGSAVDIYGNFKTEDITAPDGNKYDVAGSIQIDSITEVGNPQSGS